MFGKKCRLCGSKLDRNQICTECGLDNKKTDENYRLNKSSCDNMSLTHVHDEKKHREDRPKVQRDKQKNNQRDFGQYMEQFGKKEERKTKRKKPGCISIAVIIIIILQIVVPILGFIVDEIGSVYDSYEYSYEEYDPYEYLEEELPEDGEYAEYELTSGRYVVGVHIPVGNYVAETTDDYDAVQVNDYENGIYLYEYSGKDSENHLEDLRLFDGAVVIISSKSTVKMYSENAQISDMKGMENPLTEAVSLKSGDELAAGEDFTPGVYDVNAMGTYGYIYITITDENGEVSSEETIYLGEDESDGWGYRNLVLPDKAVVGCEENIEVVLEPSEVIQSIDYLGTYSYY